jgi:hypothetical protein
MSEGWLHLAVTSGSPWHKTPEIVRAYEGLLGPWRDHPIALLELGVSGGDSLTMWRDGLPNATIVGVDVEPPALDLGPRVHIAQGDQRDGDLLAGLRRSHAPAGFDVIIDDASHLGRHSAQSLRALFNEHLRPGGLYVIEDWRVGYFIPLAAPVATSDLGEAIEDEQLEVRMPSHDYGLVGLVKRLVDHLAMRPVQDDDPGQPHTPLAIESLTITPEMAVLRKCAGRSGS